MAANRDPWKGSTSVLILASLADEPRHGYAIAREIARRSDALITLGEGSLYPALMALEREGLITGEWQTPPTGSGPARKVYSLTDAGRSELSRRAQEVRALAQAIVQLLREVPDAPPSRA
jgi:PadR family transcriptional regulator, regulatory protein PadR